MTIAIDCFAKFGGAGTTIDRIARAAGVTKGAIYYHFRDKEHLLRESVAERIGAFERTVLDRVSPMENPGDALRAIAQICAENAVRDNHRRFILTLMVEALDTNDALSAEFREALRRFRSFHRHLIRTGQERGAFRPEIDPTVAAEMFVAGILGAEIQYYQEPDAMDITRTLDVHAELFLAWLGADLPPRRSRRGTADV